MPSLSRIHSHCHCRCRCSLRCWCRCSTLEPRVGSTASSSDLVVEIENGSAGEGRKEQTCHSTANQKTDRRAATKKKKVSRQKKHTSANSFLSCQFTCASDLLHRQNVWFLRLSFFVRSLHQRVTSQYGAPDLASASTPTAAVAAPAAHQLLDRQLRNVVIMESEEMERELTFDRHLLRHAQRRSLQGRSHSADADGSRLQLLHRAS